MTSTVESNQGVAKWAPTLAPFLLALTPVFYHWGRNYSDSHAVAAAAMLGVAVLLAGVVFGSLTPILRDRDRRAAGASIVLVFLLFYGYLFHAIWKRIPLPRPWMLHLALGGGLAGIAIAAILGLRRGSWNVARPMRAISLALGMVCALSAVQVVRGAFREKENLAQDAWAVARSKSQSPVAVAKPPINGEKPDIYYIILDCYAREDILRKVYNFDNSEFLNGLRRRGFMVSDKSCSNYPFTMLSLASSLNMTYLEGVGHSSREYDGNRKALYSMTQGNRVSRFLKTQGYRYATNLTFFKATEATETADIVYSLKPLAIRGEFMDSLMSSTAACLLRPNRVDYHLHALDSVRQAALLTGPKFVFFHIILPHPPCVFDRHGNVTQAAYSGANLENDDGDDRKQPFVEQTMFLNGKVLEFVDHILKNSSSPPVIIIQSDHGPMATTPRGAGKGDQEAWLPSAAERMPILNCFLVPEPIRRRLYPTMTPVNTFRVVLSELFGADLPLLEDHAYFCHYEKGVELKDVSDRVIPR